MKKTIVLLSMAALLATCLASAQAFPSGKSNESGDYLSGTGLSHLFSAGIYGGSNERDVKYGGAILPLESEKTMAYVGMDLRPWLTVFAGGGRTDHQIGRLEAETTYQVEAGLLINVIDHVILDPTLFEDKFRVNVGASWELTEAEWVGDDVVWQVFTGFATVSIVNDTIGNKFFNPNSIALYAGPMYSYIQSDDIEADEELGFLAGVEIFVSESISIDIGLRQFESTGFEGGLHIRF